MKRLNLKKIVGTGITSLLITVHASKAFSSGPTPIGREFIKTLSKIEETKRLPINADQFFVIRSYQSNEYRFIAYDLSSEDGAFQVRTTPRYDRNTMAIGDLLSAAREQGIEDLKATVTKSLQLYRVYDDGDVDDEVRCDVTIKFEPLSGSQNSDDLVLVGTAAKDACMSR